MRLQGRVQRLEMVCSGMGTSRHVTAFLAALVAFGEGTGEAGARRPEQPTTTVALLAALRGWGAVREGNEP